MCEDCLNHHLYVMVNLSYPTELEEFENLHLNYSPTFADFLPRLRVTEWKIF